MAYDTEERSSLWGFGAAAAMTSGVGYGLSRAHPAIKAALGTGRRDIAEEASAELRTLGRFNIAQANRPMPGGSIEDNILRNLTKSSSTATVKGDIAHAAYEAMLAGGKATQEEAYNAFQQIANQTSVTSTYRQAEQLVGNLQGDTNLLASRIKGLGTGGFYGQLGGQDTARLTEIAKAGVSQGGYFGGSLSQAQLSSFNEEIAEGVKGRLNKAAQVSGGVIDWKGVYNIEDVFEGKKVTTPMLQGLIGREAINIPLEQTGMTYGGRNLTAKYMTRQAYNTAGDLQNYTDEYVSHLEKVMSGQETKTGLKNSVIAANRQIVENMNVRDSAARSMAIWRMPETMLPAGGRVKSRLNLMEAVYSGGTMSEGLRNNILASGKGLTPFGSPETVAKGTLMKGNIAEELFGPMGRLASVESRPTQFIREEFGVTAGAKQVAPEFRGSFGQYYNRLDRKIQGPGYKGLLYGTAEMTAAEAYSAPQLTAFYAKPERLETGALAEKMFAEEAVISQKVAPMMEYERTVQKKITLEEGFRTNQQILNALKGKKTGELVGIPGITSGGFFGTEAATGRELWAEGAGGAKAEIIGAQLAGDSTATVFMKETHKMSDDKWWKFFSEDVKYMGRASTDTRMKEILAAAGVGPQAGLQDIEAVVSGKLVQRNRMALMTQQIEAMSMLSAAKIDKGEMTLRKRLLAQEFMTDPASFLKVSKLQGKNILDAESQIQNNMVSLTKKFGFTKDEMGLTFGLMDEEAAKRLGIASEVATSPGVVGLSKMRLGDFAFEGGAGGTASFEQTGMRMLAMKGEEGKRFAAELATRMKGKGELLSANKMMASILNEQELTEKMKQLITGGNIDERLLGQLKPEDLVQDTGRYVKFGKSIKAFGGAKQIYIPGLTEAETLMGHTISEKGKRIRSPIVGDLEELRNLTAKGAAEEEIEKAASKLRGTIASQTELQASAKGKVIGSRFLTGIRQTAEETIQTKGAMTISGRQGERMFQEMIDRAKTTEQRQYLSNQKDKLLKNGEELIGGMWRHPTTGPESFQFVRYKIDAKLADEMISVPRQMGELVLGGKSRPIDVSPMVGMKGDFDRDMFALAAISDRDTATRVAGKMKNEIQEGYTGYLFNHYAMKDLIDSRKGNIDSLLSASHTQAMQQGARNLTTAKIATPQVNIALQKLKLGLQHTAPDKYRPMAELFWHLEEAAISGKHGAQQSSMYQNIAHAVKQKDVSTMESVIKQLMGEKDINISGQITGPTGELQSRSLKYSPRTFAEQAISAASAAGDDVDIAVRAAQTAKGRAPEDLSALTEMYYKRRTGSLDVAQSVMHSQTYGMPGFTEKANRVLRKAQTKSRGIMGALKKAKGPAMIGTAIAAGLMLSAPAVSGALTQPRDGAAAGRNLKPDDIGPPTGMGMSPPAGRIMKSPQVYDMSGMQRASRANIRMSMSDANSSGRDFMRHASTLARGSNVRVKTVDDRSALSPHRLANKIHERL